MGSGSTAALTVRQACQNFVAHIRSKRGDIPADDLVMRFTRWVYVDKAFADIELRKLTKARVEKWCEALAKTPAKINRDKRPVPLTRTRAPASVNRDAATLKAALNRAHDEGHVTSDMAWRVALRPIPNANRRRDVYLDLTQRRALIAEAQPDLALFLSAMSLLPLRPGAIAALTAGSLDKRLSTLSIGKDKHGRDRKITLPAVTAAFFAEQCKDKLPAAPLLSPADGKAWDKDSWKKPVKAAVTSADLPAAATAYALRHSTITDLIALHKLDMLTVAQLSGTSLLMIEKHYGHLLRENAAKALASLTL
jgi:integrase